MTFESNRDDSQLPERGSLKSRGEQGLKSISKLVLEQNMSLRSGPWVLISTQEQGLTPPFLGDQRKLPGTEFIKTQNKA